MTHLAFAVGAACVMVMAIAVAPSASAAAADDRKAIEAVVESAYVQGVHVKGDPALMRQGFHPDFRMLVLREGKLVPVTLDEWAARTEKATRERKEPAPEIRHEFTMVDVTGDAAVARVEIYRAGTHVFTDDLSLYRFPEGWKIVGKIFQVHGS